MQSIFSVISTVKDMWKLKSFELVFGACLVFLVLFAIYNILFKKKGTTDKFALSVLDRYKSKSTYSSAEQSSRETEQSSRETEESSREESIYTPDNTQINKVYFSNDEGDSCGERECRRVLQEIFNQPFNRARPNFLKNPINKFNLELDCYNDNYRLAVEYNGAQHYKYIPHFHKNKEAFINQKYRDEMKRTLCKSAGVFLIEVPYTVPKAKIHSFLVQKLAEI